MTAPERIWATHSETWGAVELGQWADTVRHKGGEPYVHERLYTAQQETIAALVEALEWYESRRLDAISRVHSITAPEDEAVKHLCERHGYGAVIDSAARQWAKKPEGTAAFFVGGCIGDETARAARARAKEQA